ncbi:MAG: MBL fold metallo-hydrolase [Candidatus Cloacimonadota bacterium]|nr:MAG: MBL fold metallo-hydrolase [Candidatus Cloacimonadota bacterium]
MTFERLIVGGLETNCYILKSGKFGIIIDPGAEAKKISEKASDLDIILILLTHSHSDHIGALQEVKEAFKARAAVHQLDWRPGFDLELVDNQEIEFGEEQLKILHTPGHTPGSCCFLKGNVLFSGDTLFRDGYGNTAFPGGDEQAILRSIREKLLKLPDETNVYPGHGPSTTIGRERGLY